MKSWLEKQDQVLIVKVFCELYLSEGVGFRPTKMKQKGIAERQVLRKTHRGEKTYVDFGSWAG